MLLERLIYWAHETPDRPAINYQGEIWSYRAFVASIVRAQTYLKSAEAPNSGVAGIAAKHLVQVWVFSLAARMHGLDAIALTGREPISETEFACIISASENVEAAFNPAVPAFRVPAPSRNINGMQRELALDARQVGGQILQSSGTTGVHKRLLLPSTKENIVFRDYIEAYQDDPQKGYYALNFGLWSSAGYKAPAWKWWVGGCITFDQSEHLLERFFTDEFESTFLIQPFLKSLVEMAKAKGQRPRTTTVYFGGGPLPTALAHDAMEWVSRDLRQTYGSTEIISPCLHTESLVDQMEFHWMRSTGRRALSIIDEEGIECPPNVVGTLRIGVNPEDFHEYLHDPATSNEFFKDGWFYPGDLAIRRDDGRYRIEGRETDTIVIGGIKHGIAPLEAKARDWFGVADVCIFTRMSEEGKNEICFVLETSMTLTPALNAKMVQFLAATKIKSFERAQISIMAALPRAVDGMRKLNRKAVREAVQSKQSG